MKSWNEIPNDVFYQLLDIVQELGGSRALVGCRSICKSWREACLGYSAAIEAGLRPQVLENICRSFCSLRKLKIFPAGRFGTPQRLPKLAVLKDCPQLSDLHLIGFKYPQPWDVQHLKFFTLTRLVMEDSQPVAVAMPFLLEAVDHLASLKCLVISPPKEQRPGNCNHLLENVCFRLTNLESLKLGSAAFNQQFEGVPQDLKRLTSLELLDCGILPNWLGEVLKHLPKLETLVLMRPLHPNDWPLYNPCGELSLTNAASTLRSLHIEGASVQPKSCSHLQLENLAFGLPRVLRNFEAATQDAISLISGQTSLTRLELLSWDKVIDSSPLNILNILHLSLIECTFDACYELIGGVNWNSVIHLHANDNVQPKQVRGLLGDFLFVKFLGLPNLKSVSGSGWIIQRLAAICERLNAEGETPTRFKTETAYLRDVQFL